MSKRDDERFSWDVGKGGKREDEKFRWSSRHFLEGDDPHRHEEWRHGGRWRTGMLPDHHKFKRPKGC